MSFGDWDDRLTHRLVRPPFRDEKGRKGLLERFAHAPPHRVEWRALTLPGWPRFARPLRIAFLSDFHVGSHTGDVERLAAIVAEASALSPDLALFGGDFVNMIPFGGGRVPPHVIARLLGALNAPLGRLAVLGNHDRNYGPGEITEALRREGVTMLDAAVPHPVAFDGGEIDVLGIHDARMDQPQSRKMLAALTPQRPCLVLAHDPYWFTHLPAGPHLMLAGHTHGGQICLPLIGPLRNASRAPMRWTHGLVEEDGKRMFVTSGIGCSGLPLRIGCPPEYLMLEVNGA